jgi:hypothetical protein
MILQEGKYYRARNGRTYGPINRYKSKCNYPFFFDGDSWNENGKYNVGVYSSFDLIAELTELEASPPVINQGAPPKVDRVEIASRILPRLAPDLAPTSAARQALQYADAFIKEIGNGNDKG